MIRAAQATRTPATPVPATLYVIGEGKNAGQHKEVEGVEMSFGELESRGLLAYHLIPENAVSMTMDEMLHCPIIGLEEHAAMPSRMIVATIKETDLINWLREQGVDIPQPMPAPAGWTTVDTAAA